MKSDIKIAKGLGINRDKLLQSRMVILANSGGGKSYAIRKFAEEAMEDTQTIIIDPEGEFASLREEFDFILAGKNADVPVEIRSASLLATKLLELGKSAIIDLYELHPTERQRYVKLFFDAMVNAPKELYHPVFIVLDEAHEFAPEGKPSEATYAVEAMASRGRKRGFCLIPASQRISKLSKNLSAECNNKLIGRASQDIDMKRAGDELGFNKENMVQLRQLKPGEFFAFGPAISDEVVKVKIGEVKTAHAKVGYKGANKVPPPSHIIKKILGELSDLPQEAEKEAKTMKELKSQLDAATRIMNKMTQEKIEQGRGLDGYMKKEIAEAVKNAEKKLQDEFWLERDEWLRQIQNWFKILEEMGKAMQEFSKKKPSAKRIYISDSAKIKNDDVIKPGEVRMIPTPKAPDLSNIKVEYQRVPGDASGLGSCEKAIYSYLLYKTGTPQSKTQVAVATGFSQTSGGFNNSISKLSARGLIVRQGTMLAYPDGAPEDDSLIVSVDKSLDKWISKLPSQHSKIWALMLSHHPDETWTKEQIAGETGYSATSGGFNNSLSKLSSLGLIERLPGGMVRINPELHTI